MSRSTPLSNFFPVHQEDIIIVSGLPRSGTSMMMRTLEQGGINILTDNLRKADYDNPNGYYEMEMVKKLPCGEFSWLKEARGKAVKIISFFLKHLPDSYNYRVIFMHRNMHEILASQRKMLFNRNEKPSDTDDTTMAEMFTYHLEKINKRINTRNNFKRLDISYNKIVRNPLPYIKEIAEFTEATLDLQKMAGAVEPELYRQRNP